jgi:hypothetical protein
MLSPGGSRRALSDWDPLSVPAPGVDFLIWPRSTKGRKSRWHALGPTWRWLLSTPSCVIPCVLDSGVPIAARMCRVQETKESVARIPDLFINCADTFEFIDFLLFCYFNTREFVSFEGALLCTIINCCCLHASYMCAFGGWGGEWVP